MSPAFISGIVVFVLAAFVGLEVISKVPPTLHTPLMSGANAISGITIVGAIAAAGLGEIKDFFDGGGGVSDDFPLARMWALARTLRIADGPDEVHNMVVARREMGRIAD